MDIYKCPKMTFRKKVLTKKNKKTDSDVNAANEKIKKCHLLSQLFFEVYLADFFVSLCYRENLIK